MSSIPLRDSPDDEEVTVYASKRRKNYIIGFVVLVVIVVIVVAIYAATRSDDSSSSSSPDFASAVQASNIMVHLSSLYNISKLNPSPWSSGGCRSVIYGYNQSAEYVLQTLAQYTDLDVTTQHFYVPIFEENTKPQLSLGAIQFVEGVDFTTLRYGGDGVHDFVENAEFIANYGCDITDFDNFTSGKIAVIADGVCDYFTKGYNAQLKGARGGIISRVSASSKTLSTSRVRKTGWVEGDPVITVPFLSSTYSFYQYLSANIDTPLHWVSNTTIKYPVTFNIMAQTKHGNSAQTIIIGSHLDGVPGGPGINDNGSGSSTNLELAIQFSKSVQHPANRVRFIWWASEEEGLLGAYNYVSKLTEQEKNEIALVINLDMLASPNGVRMVGNTSIIPPNATPETLAKNYDIAKKLTVAFESQGLIWEPYDMQYGGSDFYPFLVNNVPASCLATGAGGLRTQEERSSQGGLANAAYDPCYHQTCDTIDNVDKKLLQEMASAVASVLQEYSLDANLFKGI